MNRFDNFTKPLMWFMALLLTAFVAGCGGSSSGPAALSTTKSITAYSLAWNTGTIGSATGTIDETQKTINVTVPHGTNLTPMYASFTTSGASVEVGTVTQVNGTTPNDFSNPVAYKVTAADGTWATYTVLVTVVGNSAKAITAFSFAAYSGATGTITGTASPYSIAVTVPFGTSVTALKATFSTTGNSVTVVATGTQVSGTTANNFTNPVAYTVHAADTSTATYNVTVTVAPSTAKAITAFSFVGYAAASGVIAPPSGATHGTIAVTLPNATNVTALVANFTTTGNSVTVGTAPVVTQVSSQTANNFTSPVAYTVHAADTTTAIYDVTVTVAAVTGPVVCTGNPNCVNLGTSANYVMFGKAGVTNVPTSATTGNVGSAAAATTITGFALVLDSTNVFSTSSEVTGKVYAVDYAPPTPSNVGTASTDMGNAYTAANNITGGAACPGSGNFGGLSLAPGVYTCSTAVNIATDVTLAGTGAATDVWVFQIAGTLTQASGAKVLFTGTQGALPQNVFWAVAGSVSIGTTAQMEGVILGQTDINVLAGATANGRLLAQTLVNLAGGTNTVTQP